MAMFTIFFNACTAGIGNSLIVNKEEHNIELFYNINHIAFIAINYCCACFVSICQPFMQLWVGKQYELDFPFVILFAVYLFAEEAPRTLIAFKDAGGIWKHDRFRPLLSACINLTLNLILTPIIGLYGIILSTIFALMFVAYPWLIINLNNRLIQIGIKKYLLKVLLYIIFISVSASLSYWICNLIELQLIPIAIFIRLLIATTVSTIVFMVAFWKTNENKYLLLQFISIKNKLVNR